MNTMVQPLPDRIRPQTLDDMVGQQHLLAAGRPVRALLDHGIMQSMIFWGPPGTGKTTLATIIARHYDAELIQMSAVLSGVKDVRKAVETATANQQQGRRTVLFLDEVHRFNKSQQDAFLPHIESGLFTFIGATTENPSFQVNSALLSRLKVFILKPLEISDIVRALRRALEQTSPDLAVSDAILEAMSTAADGDARRALNMLEMAIDADEDGQLDKDDLERVTSGQYRQFDQQGDVFYEQISALHKCVRSSDPDAALYWFCRMLDAGCDPEYLCRRLTRIASEDIGNADPRALTMAINAWDAWKRLGSPEGELAIAQAVLFLAVAAKSNAVYSAYKAASSEVSSSPSHAVPNHLKNAPTRLMKTLDYGQGYQYDHDSDEGVALSQTGFPESMTPVSYYRPVDRGLESRIREKLDYIRSRRYPDLDRK